MSNDDALKESILKWCVRNNARRISKEIVLQMLDRQLKWAKSWTHQGGGICNKCHQMQALYINPENRMQALCMYCLLSRAFGAITSVQQLKSVSTEATK